MALPGHVLQEGAAVARIEYQHHAAPYALYAVEKLLAGDEVIRVVRVVGIARKRHPVAGVVAVHVAVGAQVYDADVLVRGSGEVAGDSGQAAAGWINKRSKSMDKKAFSDFLFAIGLNQNGVNETLKRFDEEKPDEMDLIYLKRFKAENHD